MPSHPAGSVSGRFVLDMSGKASRSHRCDGLPTLGRVWRRHWARSVGKGFRLAGMLACCLVSVLSGLGKAAEPAESPSPLIGRWDLTVQGAEGSYPSWIEVRKSGTNTLVGAYVGQFGSARPISFVKVDGDSFRFQIPPQWEKRSTDVVVEGKLTGDQLSGVVTGDQGEALPWKGVRAPQLKRSAEPQWGEPIELFNGKDLTGWQAMSSTVPNGWEVKDGVLVNAKPGNNLRTTATFSDFKLHAEFRHPAGSNSGVYLRGRYEVQIEDNFGQEPDSHLIGGVYGFLNPSINAAKPAGEWQTYDITLVGRMVTVVLNGERIIDRQTIPGITGGAIDSNEGSDGPLYLQGDHGPVEFRNLVLTPAVK